MIGRVLFEAPCTVLPRSLLGLHSGRAMSRIYPSRFLPRAPTSASRSRVVSTRAARWRGCRANGLKVYCLHRRSGAAGRGRPCATSAGWPRQHGAVARRAWWTVARRIVREGVVAIQCWRLPPRAGRQEVLQHHAASAARSPRPPSSAPCARTTCTCSATAARTRATTSSASTATASLDEPGRSRSTSPGSTGAFVDAFGGRTGDERVPGARWACRTPWARRRRTAPTRTCSARRTRRRTSSTSISGIEHRRADHGGRAT